MFPIYSKVKLNLNYSRVLSPDMVKWMNEHADNIFVIEKSDMNSSKLFKIDFWITNDLLSIT